MTCPTCGAENAQGTRLCGTCGTVLAEGGETEVLATHEPVESPGGTTGVLPPSPYPPGDSSGTLAGAGPPARSPLAAAMATGWGKAAASAGLTFLIMLLIGEGLAALLYAASGSGAVGDILRIGALFTYSFHRVGVVANLPDFNPAEGAPGGVLPGGSVSVQFTIAVAMLLATVLLFWLLWRAGRSLGEDSGGPSWVRGLSGARVAVPYVVIAGLGALLLSLAPLTFQIPDVGGFFPAGGELQVTPAVAAAFLWPLAIAALAGFGGGFVSGPREVPARDRFEALGPAAFRGGLAMIGWGLLLGFLGFEVLAFIHGDAALPYNPEFVNGLFEAGGLEGVSALVLSLMLVPNLGALVLVPAMGSSLGVFGGGVSFPLLSYLKFPTGFDPSALAGLSGLGTPGAVPDQLVQTQIAPAGYWAFLLVPLLATVLGGRLAARRAGAATTGEGAIAGALAGVVYGLLVVGVAVMAGIGFKVDSAFSGLSQSQGGHFGAHLPLTLLLGVLWGVVGGAVGGALGVGRDASADGPAPAAYGFGAVPPPPAPDAPRDAARDTADGVPPPPVPDERR